jgi:hypothetical protein
VNGNDHHADDPTPRSIRDAIKDYMADTRPLKRSMLAKVRD